METLPHITQQRNRHYSGTCSSRSSTSGGCGEGGRGGGDEGGGGASGRFSEIGCPMVESEVGLHPSPSKSYGSPRPKGALLGSPCVYNGGKSMVLVGDDMESNKGVISSPGLNRALLRTPCGYNGGKSMVVDDAMEFKKGAMSSHVGWNLKRSALLRTPCGYNGGKSMVVGGDMESNKGLISSPGLNCVLSRTACGYNGGKSMVVDDAMESKKGVMSSSVGVNLERSALLRTPCGYNGGNSVVDDEAMESKNGVIHSPMSMNLEGSGIMMNKSRDSLFLSERWAGPTYPNSPPPSCLPMPKFSMNEKRSVSLELPLKSGSRLQKVVKSAPTSPKRDSCGRLISSLCDDDCATRSLRRILNLDISDD